MPSRELVTDPYIQAMRNADLKALYELKDARGLNVRLSRRYSSYEALQFGNDTKWVSAMKGIV